MTMNPQPPHTNQPHLELEPMEPTEQLPRMDLDKGKPPLPVQALTAADVAQIAPEAETPLQLRVTNLEAQIRGLQQKTGAQSREIAVLASQADSLVQQLQTLQGTLDGLIAATARVTGIDPSSSLQTKT